MQCFADSALKQSVSHLLNIQLLIFLLSHCLDIDQTKTSMGDADQNHLIALNVVAKSVKHRFG
ncbi:hypothetical protein D3C75_731770 [compost metagenome]